MKKIMLTGGGSAGHVTVNLALLPKLLQAGWNVKYIGSENGIEKELIQDAAQISYYSISTGKLRRYFDWQNIKDPFKVVKGAYQAYRIMKKEKPNIVFSKGGFVSVPVVLGAWLNRIPVIIHESDYTPGLANKLAAPFAKLICTTFPETAEGLNMQKCAYTGPVLRENLLQGNAGRARSFVGMKDSKLPVVLVMGGSLGARSINTAIRQSLSQLTKQYFIIHICGKGQIDETAEHSHYRQYEYIHEQIADILALSDYVISRAGSNSIFEFLALRKPMLLVPLSKNQSRGDQILNAASFEKAGYCKVLLEENLSSSSLIKSLEQLALQKEDYKEQMSKFNQQDALMQLYKLIEDVAFQSTK